MPTRLSPTNTPNASSNNWETPQTSRLAPETIWSLASSMVAMVSVAPGRKVTSAGATSRIGSSWTNGATTFTAITVTRKDAMTGSATDSVAHLSATIRRMPTKAPSAA